MKSIRRISALALAATALLTPAVARADTPYAQASAMVEADGSVARSKNVVDVWRPHRGTYCVLVDKSVDLHGAVAIHATPEGWYEHPRSLSVQLGSRTCHDHHHGGHFRTDDQFRTIAVHSQTSHGYRADAAFYLTVS
ncbi:hypothetical protein ETD86_11245 [Nonomuraea turkmeniaca]|uniref:Uncharacterized protein n=1 Tax=Nonomuraea turkmeniaca TaxID=103838 RepID=A0A5S4FPQ4_9ACTN|nr:hypothetical protein [Nonomuraea turkmeniaca]TMR22559.1 hypothetical protein ETD86_11245 [Nonomuraea turkmeniaca]